jgi:bifunctional N-acetylglucosamine-1-phosphate-uridyltransferase/glucosamine-1-phosphate-acetyltransferase GlmU-like protein
MGSAAITTVVKMMESLPESAQNLVVDHLREYITTMQDEDAWDTAFQKTQPQLAEAARAAKQQIAAGQAKPMDYNRL